MNRHLTALLLIWLPFIAFMLYIVLHAEEVQRWSTWAYWLIPISFVATILVMRGWQSLSRRSSRERKRAAGAS